MLSEKIGAEFEGIRLGDKRLEKRCHRMVERMSESPSKSFPELFPEPAELEAAYRFLNNEQVDSERLLTSHFAATANRASETGPLLVVHDTTQLLYRGEPYTETSRKGLGQLGSKHVGQGFFLHGSLVVQPEGDSSIALGLIHTHIWSRSEDRDARGAKEVERWSKCAAASKARLGSQRLVHVMDREAENYELFDGLINQGDGFVIRVRHNRRLKKTDTAAQKMFETLDGLEPKMRRRIGLGARKASGNKHKRKSMPTRYARMATVVVRAAPVEIRRTPSASADCSKSLALHYVHLVEPDPPEGQTAVDWKILTTEPVETEAQVEAVIDTYRRRWLIEEFFKSLKTGCAIEKRQMQSLAALSNVLALSLPMAWHMLALRTIAEQLPKTKADRLVNDTQRQILQTLSPRPLAKRGATAVDVLDAIAAFGGHIKRNGKPGWITLARGYLQLLFAENIWNAATKHTCNQS